MAIPFYPQEFSVVEVVAQYDSFFSLGLTDLEKSDLIQFLFGPVAPASRLANNATGDGDLIKPDGWS